MRVNFIIIGAMKCGTRTLSKILADHPEVSFSNPKEPGFFSHTNNWKENVSAYHNLFEEKEGHIYGESSTAYSKYPSYNLGIWEDIYEYNKDMKLIYIVRNPIDRVVSHYMHAFQRGYISLSFEKAILKFPEFINASRYFTQIKPFIDQFGIENIFIIDFDDLIMERRELLRALAAFLNINFKGFKNYENTHENRSIGKKAVHHKYDKIVKILTPLISVLPDFLKHNLSHLLKKKGLGSKPHLNPKYREMIINMTRLDILALEEMSGKNFSKWLSEDYY